MITKIDTTNPVEIRAAGIRALNEALGQDLTQIFINQYFGGVGDYTKEKNEHPDLTAVEFAEIIELAKAESESIRMK
jgi:hypothetical protein